MHSNLHELHRAAAVLVWISSTTFFACSKDGPEPPPSVAKRVAPPLIESRAHAAKITHVDQLIGGVTAKGRVGDFKIWNEHLAVIIGDAGHGEGYDPYGGTILDADRIRPGQAGRSRFGELLLTIDLKVQRPDEVRVLADGHDGRAAIIEVIGAEAPLPLLEALLPSYALDAPRDLGIVTRYVLEPGAEALLIEVELENRGTREAHVRFAVAGFIFGDGAEPFVPGFGFVLPASGATASSYAAVGDDVTYLFARDDGPLNYIAAYSGILAAHAGGDLALAPGRKRKLQYYLFVGDGDLNRAQRLTRSVLPSPPVREVRGRITDDRGNPVPGARVHVVESTPKDAGRDYVTMSRSGPDGKFTLELTRGSYQLLVSTPAQSRSGSVAVSIEADDVPMELDFQVPSTGAVRYDLRDSSGLPLPGKITAVRTDGAMHLLPERFGEVQRPGAVVLTEYAIRGEGRFELPPGNYRLHATRGGEYEMAARDVTITGGEELVFSAVLERSVDTAGWMSTDTHIHGQLSADSSDLYDHLVSALVAEGLEFPVSTEHEALGDFAPAIAALGLGRWIKGVVGTEVTTSVYGHFNAFPLEHDLSLPGRGRIDWLGKTPAELFAVLRANPADPVIQVNHPRWGRIGGYFDAMGVDRETGLASDPRHSEDYDTIEIMNQCDVAAAEAIALPDWFNLLDRGVKKSATAGSDSHTAVHGELGYPRTYVAMPTDAPSEASVDDLRASFRQGRVIVTCGPFVELSAGPARIGDQLSVQGDRLTVEARVGAPSWMRADHLEVIVNRAVVASIALEGRDPLRFSGTLDVPIPAGRDAWVLLRVRSDGPHDLMIHEPQGWAITNPIYLDGDGDGRFAGTR